MALTDKLTAIADAIRVQSGKTDKLSLDQMPDEIIGLQSLSFEVIPNPKPETAKENTIWVDTDSITSWVFSANAPENPEEGMVWISTGVSSPTAFNALKKNGITVYPISAKQYVGGEWVRVTAQTYQSGAWASWTTYYYKNGNTYDGVTGGYTLDDATLEADNIKIHITSDGQVGYITTNNKVDVSGISTLSVKFNIKTVSSYTRTITVYLYASDSKLTSPDGSVGSGATVTKAYQEGVDVEDTISLDVSSVTGEKYIFVAVKNGGKYLTTTMNIKEIRGE